MENRGRKLSEERRARICKLLEEGMSVRHVARVLQVAASTVQKIRSAATPIVARRASEGNAASTCNEVRTCAAAETCANAPQEQQPESAKICLLTKRTESQVNDPARCEKRAEAKVLSHRKWSPLTLGMGLGLVIASLVRELEIWLLTKRTRSKLNDAALIEKPPDG
ncbi:helix-turn-helix domain-containing protein [Blastopirellula marina]|uniref:Transposase IS30-like HTH domain-containing protein n=1 Tax=Blastopirellula marina TaxID=124 RepID=A0A2S8GN40_9BACT|nr:hypothetical protein C5Y93_11400 [Blastopirellula marina]